MRSVPSTVTPASGVVVARSAVLGAYVTPETALYELRDADTLQEVPSGAPIERSAVLLVAGSIGTTRLLDNVILGV